MRKFFKNWMVLLMMGFAVLVMVGLETPSSQEQGQSLPSPGNEYAPDPATPQPYSNYVGKVVTVYKDLLSVKGSKGDVMHFVMWRKTIYVPAHLPAVGDRVKVIYYFKKPDNVAHQVEILPPPPPPPPPRAVPTTTLTAPQEEAKEKKSIFGCTRCSSPRGSGAKK